MSSNNATILEAKDSVSRKETLLDKNYSLEVAEARKNTRIPSSAGEQTIRIGSLSKLPSIWNSDGMKNGSIATQGAASNGLQGVAPMSNVSMLDHTDNGHKTSIHLLLFLVNGTKLLNTCETGI